MKRNVLTVVLMCLLFVSASSVQADGGADVTPVIYAEVPEEMIFEWLPPQHVSFVRLVVELPWSGKSWEIVPSKSDGIYEGRINVADIPILTAMRFHWRGLSTDTGEPVRTLWESIDRPDPNSQAAEWHCHPGQHVDVCVHWEDKGLARKWIIAGDAGYDNAEQILGEAVREHGARPRIVIFANKTFYWMVSPEPDSAGIALPDYGVTLQYVAGNKELVDGTIPHEVMHLLDPTSKRLDVPRWFTEGLAVANEVASHDDEIAIVRDARRDRLLYSWETMRWRCDSAWCDRTLWYAQSYHMLDAIGLDKAQAIVSAMETRGFAGAWRHTMGLSPQDWGARYTRRQMWRWDIVATGSALVIVVGYALYRRRR